MCNHNKTPSDEPSRVPKSNIYTMHIEEMYTLMEQIKSHLRFMKEMLTDDGKVGTIAKSCKINETIMNKTGISF